MDFPKTDEQTMLVDTFDRVFQENYDYAAVLEARVTGQAWDDKLITSLLEVGLGGLTLPPDLGGFGGGSMESGLLMEQAGRWGLAEPMLTSILVAGRIVAACAPSDDATPLATALLSGKLPLAATGLADEPSDLALSADGEALRVSGRLANVVGLHGAEWLVHLMPDDHVVAVRAGGLAGQAIRRLDGVWAHDLDLTDVPATSWGSHFSAVAQIRRQAIVDLCWNGLGALSAAATQTAAYVKDRRQFGRALAEFQVIQHRLAEMFALIDEVRAVLYVVSALLDDDNASDHDIARLICVAKVRTGRAARYVAREAVQLHGGMGISDETPVANLFRHLTAFEAQLGTTFDQRRRYGKHVLAGGAYRDSAVLPWERLSQ